MLRGMGGGEEGGYIKCKWFRVKCLMRRICSQVSLGMPINYCCCACWANNLTFEFVRTQKDLLNVVVGFFNFKSDLMDHSYCLMSRVFNFVLSIVWSKQRHLFSTLSSKNT